MVENEIKGPVTLTLNSDPFITVPQGTTENIELLDQNNDPIVPDSVVDNVITVTVGSTPVGAKLMKTGQTTSYRTGDDGDIEAGRDVSFSVLAENNPFGNTNRFTDELGGQTYTNNIVIDWSTYDGTTVLGYRRILVSVASGGWNNVIDTCLSLSNGGFSSGWRLANKKEFENIMIVTSLEPFNYSPFSLSTSGLSLHTSTTWVANTSLSWGMSQYGQMGSKDKTETSGGLAVRTFTVSGTTLS